MTILGSSLKWNFPERFKAYAYWFYNMHGFGRKTIQVRPQTFGKWYFEERYKYFKKSIPIKRMYFDFLRWATRESGSNLLDGTGKSALDVGCAYGFVVELLKELGYDAYGIDVSKFAVSNVKGAILGDAEHLPLKCSSFDLITCFETIEHLRMPESFLKDAHRILKPSGLFIFSTPVLGLSSTILHLMIREPPSFHPNIRSVGQWLKVLRSSGFKIIAIEPYLFLPVPPTLFKRYFIFHQAPELISSNVRIILKKPSRRPSPQSRLVDEPKTAFSFGDSFMI